MTTKTTRIIDLNLFSGSSELLRQAAGGYYGDLAGTGDVSFRGAGITDIGGVESIEESEVDTTSDTILPKVKYASRLYVDEEQGFLSDDDWKTFIIGGTYADKTYSGLYNEAVYADHANNSPLPYVPREAVNNKNIEPSLVLTTEYFNYYPRFQSEVNSLESELQAPNYYLLDSASYLVPSYNEEIVQSRYQYSNLTTFLTGGYVNSPKPLDMRMENIFVLDGDILDENNETRLDTSDLNSDFVDGDLSKLYSLMPFGNKLEIKRDLANPSPRLSSRRFREVIRDHNYELKFTKLLKEIFQGESRLQPATMNFAVNTEAESSTGILTGSFETTTTIPVRLVDAPTMLLYAYQNPMSETNNIAVLNSGSHQEQIDYALDVSGSYRYENTEKSLGVLNDFVAKIKNNFETEKTYPLQNFLNQADESKYHETIAFRIEKIGGAPTGDARTENTIQNIWFYNVGGAITYLDTQVKYNSDYTYKVYKYDLVQGYKYQLSDIVTTRQIATTSSGENQVYCLEFYDPLSGQTADSLLDLSSLGGITDRKTMLQNKVSIIDELVADMTYQKDTVMATIDARLGSHEGQLSSGTPYYLTTLKNVIINPIITNSPDFLPYFSVVPHPDFPIELPYLEEYITFSSEDFPELGTFGFSVISEIGDDAVSRVNPDFNRLKLQKINSLPDTNNLRTYIQDLMGSIEDSIVTLNDLKSELQTEIDEIDELLGFVGDQSTTSLSRANSSYPYLADFNITIEPSLKIVEIPLEEKRMRIVDHAPNDFVITPHHLLDQSNRLAFYCKYDTFSMNAVTYPPTLSARDIQNRDAYLTGHDFLQISKLTQESVSRPRFLEVYRTTTKPVNYEAFSGTLRNTIDLKQSNGDIPTDHLFIERVKENTIYYYAFRALNENGVAGQMSPVFEAELVNDGGYVYGRFQQYSEEDLAEPSPKEPLTAVKKLINIVPNIQHLELDTSAVDFADPSSTAIDSIQLGPNVIDPLFRSDANRYFKIRLTSRKTGRKLDINIGFNKKVRK